MTAVLLNFPWSGLCLKDVESVSSVISMHGSALGTATGEGRSLPPLPLPPPLVSVGLSELSVEPRPDYRIAADRSEKDGQCRPT